MPSEHEPVRRTSIALDQAAGGYPAVARARRLLGLAGSLPARALTGLIRLYQVVVSPALPPSCRFYPSCSQYALEAVRRHGAFRGSWLGLRRLLRCHPWHPGGYDPVP